MPNLRERKKDRTRRRLLEIADSLFRRKGYEATTLEEICERAEISPRTFFRYFESKRDLALYENLRNVRRLRELLAAAGPERDTLDRLQDAYQDMARELQGDSGAFHRVHLMSREPSLASRSLLLDLDTERRIAEALVAQHGDERRLEAQLVATLLVGGIRAQLLECLAADDPLLLSQRIAEVFRRARESRLLPTAKEPSDGRAK